MSVTIIILVVTRLIMADIRSTFLAKILKVKLIKVLLVNTLKLLCPLYPLPATDSDECVVAVLSCWWRCWRLPAPVSSDSSLVQPSHWSIVRYPPLFCNYSPSFTAGIVRGSPDLGPGVMVAQGAVQEQEQGRSRRVAVTV